MGIDQVVDDDPQNLALQPTIYVHCPDAAKPLGGVKVLYRHVNILIEHGFAARIVHQQQGFKPQWLDIEVPVIYHPPPIRRNIDIAVFPEVYASRILEGGESIRRVIFSQNAYYTYSSTPLRAATVSLYNRAGVIGAIVMSEDSRRYLTYAFPALNVQRIWCSIDREIYRPEQKQKQICLWPRKNLQDVKQVLNLLTERRALRGWKVLLLDKMGEEKRAQAIRESAIYLHFETPEGFPLNLAEAMRTGCVAVGYSGRGGSEFMLDAFSYPIECGDVIGFAQTVEGLIQEFENFPQRVENMGRHAAAFVAREYSEQRERNSVVQCWNRFCGLEGREGT
jgi:glycosyltransferase involved in cell wall biosynthesis